MFVKPSLDEDVVVGEAALVLDRGPGHVALARHELEQLVRVPTRVTLANVQILNGKSLKRSKTIEH